MHHATISKKLRDSCLSCKHRERDKLTYEYFCKTLSLVKKQYCCSLSEIVCDKWERRVYEVENE